jgi:hypothetical protein
MLKTLVIFFVGLSLSYSFHSRFLIADRNSCRRAFSSIYSLDDSSIQKLEELNQKYERLSNVVSPETDSEKAQIEELVQKYNLYKEIKVMMSKLRMMWKVEVSETRKERQVKSFKELLKGKMEIEELLKQKLGLPFKKDIGLIPEIQAIEQIDNEINQLEAKLDKVKFVLPEGKSTREARYS